MRFVDLFAGLGGFHVALRRLGHKCVFASEINDELRGIYSLNFPEIASKIVGDIRKHQDSVPAHDILCAGFPCQPFSKSGFQRGMDDQIHGTLFHEIINILKRHKPEYIILENVGNFERHDDGHTWKVVKRALEILNYHVKGTEHVNSGGNGLLSPHHLGYPHTRERFYIVARHGKPLPESPFPDINRDRITTLASIVQHPQELTKGQREESNLSHQQFECIEHWNLLLKRLPHKVELPSFPIWSDELDARYRFEEQTPYLMTTRALKLALNNDPKYTRDLTHEQLFRLLPSYAQSKEEIFPNWKIQFIRQNRAWLMKNRRFFTKRWIEKLRTSWWLHDRGSCARLVCARVSHRHAA